MNEPTPYELGVLDERKRWVDHIRAVIRNPAACDHPVRIVLGSIIAERDPFDPSGADTEEP